MRVRVVLVGARGGGTHLNSSGSSKALISGDTLLVRDETVGD